eukprot:g13447.t1
MRVKLRRKCELHDEFWCGRELCVELRGHDDKAHVELRCRSELRVELRGKCELRVELWGGHEQCVELRDHDGKTHVKLWCRCELRVKLRCKCELRVELRGPDGGTPNESRQPTEKSKRDGELPGGAASGGAASAIWTLRVAVQLPACAVPESAADVTCAVSEPANAVVYKPAAAKSKRGASRYGSGTATASWGEYKYDCSANR